MAHQYHTNNLNVNLTDFSNDGSMEEYLNGITMDNPNFDKAVIIILWEVYINRFDQFFVKNLNFSEDFMKFSLRSLLNSFLKYSTPKWITKQISINYGLKMVNIILNNLVEIMKAYKIGNKIFDKDEV